MFVFTLVVSYFVVGTVAFLIGGQSRQKKIERELIKVLEEHAAQLKK